MYLHTHVRVYIYIYIYILVYGFEKHEIRVISAFTVEYLQYRSYANIFNYI
jgi:hypothetical protein